jgi:hypothetical protein
MWLSTCALNYHQENSIRFMPKLKLPSPTKREREKEREREREKI